MTNDKSHRGVYYSVRNIGDQLWKWEIAPPTCIRGLCAQTGTVNGAHNDAVLAAKKAIEGQTTQYPH